MDTTTMTSKRLSRRSLSPSLCVRCLAPATIRIDGTGGEPRGYCQRCYDKGEIRLMTAIVRGDVEGEVFLGPEWEPIRIRSTAADSHPSVLTLRALIQGTLAVLAIVVALAVLGASEHSDKPQPKWKGPRLEAKGRW